MLKALETGHSELIYCALAGWVASDNYLTSLSFSDGYTNT